ncbi:gamma-glutamyltransferase [Limnoglobus roseus]|uniref:Glutathione hydrolase proenzyme n=1 Tax=Limnoglobus roseus TaxID=2598579 RepID=A0A5C1ASI4_9BACT|nr:gamma-glutamyltransferase [Limnoglobus roseus]QEL21117.1 gamma-glutamyltransferase [Limnoglobus roseus]
MRTLLTLLVLALPVFAQSPRPPVESKNGMVVCVCPLAADVGAKVLADGGNAVDAAVAVAFAEAVTWPEAGNIGGGGFMLVRPNDGKDATFFDYRETAPAAATKTLFADGTTDWRSHKSAGVPGTVRGLELAHKRFGSKPWKDLVAPAVMLAKDGFAIDGPLAKRLNDILADGKTTNAEFRRIFGKADGSKWQAGDTLRQTNLGTTLAGIAEHGPAWFYTGPPAEQLDAEMKDGGGLITKADLAGYAAKERKPLTGTYRGYDIVAAPPPSSGGTAILEALNVLEQFDVKAHPRHSVETIHLIAEVQRRVFRDRAEFLGDTDFLTVPPHLTTKEYAKKVAATIDPNKATPSESLAGTIPIAETGGNTTHFSVIDKTGFAVSNTYTLENNFGSRIAVRGAGFILNNEMTDFNPIPGTTTRTGKIGTEPNQIVPGKRMLSSMTPTIVTKGGQPYLVTGSPGGRTIINTVLCVLVNTLDYDMSPTAAVDVARQHHQWFPDQLAVEKFPGSDDVIAKLKAMGHKVVDAKQGDAHSIRIDPTGTFSGAADKRINGKASGVK